MTRPVVFFEIRGRDGENLKKFYASLFGWKIDSNNPMNFGMVEHGIGGPPEGVPGGITQSDDPLVMIYVQVLDLNETLAKAEGMGGKTVMQPMDVPDGPTIAAFQDPEGNTIGLVKQ